MDPPVEGATGPQAFSSRRDKQDWEQGKGLVLPDAAGLKLTGHAGGVAPVAGSQGLL